MSMGGERTKQIILPDALSSKRPGPGERKLEGYRELSAVLRSKQLLSEWRSPRADSESISDLQLREALTRTLSEHSHFGYIRAGSKLPHSHPRSSGSRLRMSTESGSVDFLRPNGTDWLGSTTAPGEGNWSVIPRTGSRLFVFDLDVAKLQTLADGTKIPTDSDARYLEARNSLGYLRELLGVDLRSTYAQLSPSGGVHIFVLLPSGVDPKDLPSAKISDGMRALAGIPKEHWGSELRGDLRSGASNGFILMAGSQLAGVTASSAGSEDYYRPLVSDPRWSDFKDYRSARKLRLLELPLEAVERLRAAKLLDLELRASTATPDGATSAASPVRAPRRLRPELRPGSYSRLLKRLEDEPPRSFHAARAQIYRALSCCGSLESIAALCRDAGYGRDSHSNRELSDGELLADMESMERRGLRASRCGSHCGSVATGSAELGGRELELSTLREAIQGAELTADPELSALSYRRMEESSLLRARAMMDRRAQRESAYGIYGSRNPRGLDYRAVTREILGERAFQDRLAGGSRAIAGYRLRALELTVGYFGPLFAAGAPVAIAPASELMELFGWSRSQLREALRYLRATSVISLERRQISGKASAYGPGSARFFDAALSRRLRSTWGGSLVANDAGEKAFLGGFFDPSRGRIVRPDGSSYADSYLREIGGSFSGLLIELAVELPRARRVANSVVKRYLSKALARYLAVSSNAESSDESFEDPRPKSTSRAEPSLRSRNQFSNSAHLRMSERAFCEHRPAGMSRTQRARKICRSSRSDRPPPDEPG